MIKYSEKYEYYFNKIKKFDKYYQIISVIVALILIISIIISFFLNIENALRSKIVCLIIAAIIGIISPYFVIEVQFRKLLNDLRIADILNSNRQYILILRSFKTPFDSDRILVTKTYVGPEYAEWSKDEYMERGIGIFSELLQDKLAYHIIFIGGPIVNEDSIVLKSSNSEWFKEFKIYVKYSKSIIIIPGGTDSVLKEMLYCFNEFKNKCIIVMPGTQYNKYENGAVSSQREDTWIALRELIYQNSGVNLPDYNYSGCFIKFRNDNLKTYDFNDGTFIDLVDEQPDTDFGIQNAIKEDTEILKSGLHVIFLKKMILIISIQILLYLFFTLLSALMIHLDASWFRTPSYIIYFILFFNIAYLMGIKFNWGPSIVGGIVIYILYQVGCFNS